MTTLQRGSTAELTERDFQRQVTELAELFGWQWAHFRPAMRANGSWYTPVSGPLGAGWPDLVLIRRRRIIFAELKRGNGRLSADQEQVMTALFELVADPPGGPRIEASVWRPTDWDAIEETLR